MLRGLVDMVVLLVVVVVTTGVRGLAEPAKCCFSRQFTVHLDEVGKVHYSSSGSPSGVQKMTYDFDAQLMVTTEEEGQVGSASYNRTSVLMDHAAMRLYTIIERGAPGVVTCTYTHMMMDMRRHCVPADANYVGQAVLGSGSGSLHADAWEFQEARYPQGSLSKLVVAATPDCTPILAITTNIDHGVATESTVLFSHFQTESPENVRSALTIPANCQQVSGHMVGRRSFPFFH